MINKDGSPGKLTWVRAVEWTVPEMHHTCDNEHDADSSEASVGNKVDRKEERESFRPGTKISGIKYELVLTIRAIVIEGIKHKGN